MADGSVLIDTKLNTSPVEKGLNALKSMLSGAGSGIAKAGATVFSGITTAIAAAGASMAAMGGFAVKAGMDFDSAMSQVAATMGKNVDAIPSLSDAAREMGETTAFSATQAAEALNYLALAGYEAGTAADVLPAVLDLAAAGSMDLAYASDLATDAMSALGIEASKENLTQFGDQMAMTASKANTSVAQLGEAILNIGGTAKSLSRGTVELNTALGVLANRGIKGSEAGNHLRNVIMSLTAPTDKASKALKKMGIQVADSNGKMKPLNKLMAEFNQKTAGMSDVARQEYLAQIFNKEDLAAVQALLAGCGEEWDELEQSISDADGAMSQMAKTQLDNLAGDVTILKSALEGLGIAAYEQVKGPLRQIVQRGTEMISTLSQAMTDGGFTGFASALGGVLAEGIAELSGYAPSLIQTGSDVITSLVKGISDNADTISEASASALGSLVTAVIGLLPDLTVAAARLILSFAERIPNLLKLVVSAVKNVDWAQCGKDVLDLIIGSFSSWEDENGDIGMLAKTVLSKLTECLTGGSSEEIGSSIGSLIGGITAENLCAGAPIAAQAVFDALVSGIGAITTGAADIAGAIAGFLGGINKEGLGTSIGTAASTILDAIFDAIKTSTKTPDMSRLCVNIGNGIRESITFLGDIAGAIAGYITSPEGISSLMDAGGSLAAALMMGITAAFHGMITGLGNALSSIFGSVTTNILEAMGLDPEQVKADLDAFFDGLTGETGQAIGSMTEDQMKAYGYQLTNGLGTVLEQAQAWLALESAGYGDVFRQYAEASFTTAGVALAAALEDGFSGNAEQQAMAMAALMVNGMGDGLKEKYPELAEAAVALIADGFEPSIEEACESLNIPVPDTLQEALGDHIERVQQAAENLSEATTTAQEAQTAVKEAQSGVETAAETITSEVDSVGSNVESAAKTVTDAVDGMAEEIVKTVEEAAPTAAEAGAAVVKGIADGVVSASVVDAFASGADTVYTSLKSAIDTEFGSYDGGVATSFSDEGKSVVDGIVDGMILHAVVSTFSDGANRVYAAAKTALESACASSKFEYIGEMICEGIAQGIRNNSSLISDAAKDAAQNAYDTVKDTLEIHSPSKKFIELGRYCAIGLADGIMEDSGIFVRVCEDLIDSARQYLASSDILSAAADRMRFSVDMSASYGRFGSGEQQRGMDYTELAQAIWEEAPEDLALNQTINFNQPVKTPDETAREIRMQNTYGLAGAKT